MKIDYQSMSEEELAALYDDDVEDRLARLDEPMIPEPWEVLVKPNILKEPV